MYKRRRPNKRSFIRANTAVGRDKELLPVERDPHLLHLLHSREVGPRGEDLPAQDSTDSSRMNDKMERNKGEGELEEGEIDGSKAATADDNGNKRAKLMNTMGNDVDYDDDRYRKADSSKKSNQEETPSVAQPFFLRDPFTNEEFEAIQKHSKSLLVQSVESLETEGFRAFREWRAKSETVASDDMAEREERVKEALQDAKILGVPRTYQQRLFEIACQRNTIVHLGTGSGKTLIALMCIRHFASGFEEGKQTLFLVPSVALAVQQSQVLRSNLPYKVGLACYATSTTIKARRELQECNIIVATHGAIHDLLMHYGDVFSIKRFNLLILDEAHYAIGNHSYAAVMKRFYHVLPDNERPRVLGLTASPLVKVKATHSDDNLATMLHTLESTLDATVVSHVTDDPTGDGLSNKNVVEKDIIYDTNVCLEPLPALNTFKIHATRNRECLQIFQLYENLGPLAVSIYCQTLAREVSRNSFEQETDTDFKNLVNYLLEISKFCDCQSRQCQYGGRSDKLLALEALLEDQIEDHGGADTVCLVFVERRITALALNDFFRFRLKQCANDNWIRATEAREKRRVAEGMAHTHCQATVQLVDSDSARSSPSTVVMRTSPSNSWDQFADAESDAEMEFVSAAVVDKQEMIAQSVRPAQTQSSQFMDASDDEESLECFDVYRQIREQNSLGRRATGHGLSYFNHASSSKTLEGSKQTSDPLENMDDASAKQSSYESNSEEAINFSIPVPPENAERKPASVDQFNDPEGERASDLFAPKQHESIRCEALVRQATGIFKSLNMARKLTANNDEEKETWLHQEKQIEDVLSSLRRRDINVLIATSVVEEGIDVQACSCVVAFDALRSAKGYIQMKGRARQQNAKFWVMKERNDQSSALSLYDAQLLERRIHRFISSRSSVPLPISPIESDDEHIGGVTDCVELRAIELGKYSSKERHGSVDLHTAKSLVNRYILSLPLDPIVRTSKAALLACLPVYNERQLYLPAHLPSKLRVINLPKKFWSLSKKKKDQVLALMACVRLHTSGVLNDRLLPLNRCDLIDTMLAKATQQPRRIERDTFGTFGTSTRRFFVYPLNQVNSRMNKLHKILRSEEGQQLAVISTTDVLCDITPPVKFLHPGFGQVSCSLGKCFSFLCSPREFQIIERFFKFLFDARWRRRTKSVFFRSKDFGGLSTSTAPYFVGCLSPSGELDWAVMESLVSESRRSQAERIEAVRSTSDVQGLPRPRLVSPLYDPNFTYIAYGISGLNCSAEFPAGEKTAKTYQDYFKACRNFDVSKECLLFDAQRLWVLPFSKVCNEDQDDRNFMPKIPESGSHSKKHEVCHELKSLLLPKDAFMEADCLADPSMLLLSTHLPQFLHHMQTYLTAHSFIKHCEAHLPRLAKCLSTLSLSSIVTALTSLSCSEEDSYDKLEWLGDAVLKLAQTQSLMYSRDFSHLVELLHEGDLSTLRSGEFRVFRAESFCCLSIQKAHHVHGLRTSPVMGCNDRLATVCKGLRISDFLLTSPFGRGQWAPSTLELYSPATKGKDTGIGASLHEPIPRKTFADVVESILGLVYLNCGFQEACAVAYELQVSLPIDKTRSPGLQNNHIRPQPKPNLLAAATAFTGHMNWLKHELVEEAFTHPTAMHPVVPSYQRLEWVGDAVLCLSIREWIYKTLTSLPVGDSVMVSAALESNETLSYLAVKNGLLKLLNHADQTLPSRIEMYQWRTEQLGRGLWGTDPPKVAADVVEALIGAVYMDSGFESGMAASTKILAPMCAVLQDIQVEDSSIVMMHPRKALQEMGGSVLELKVMREDKFAAFKSETPLWLGKRWGNAQLDGTRFVGCIECLGTSIVSVSDPSSEVAGNRACALAVEILRRDLGLLARLKTVRAMVESCSSREAKRMADSAKDVLDSSISETASVRGDASEIVGNAVGGKGGPSNLADLPLQTANDSYQFKPQGPSQERMAIEQAAGSTNDDSIDEDEDSEMQAIVRSVIATVLPDSE